VYKDGKSSEIRREGQQLETTDKTGHQWKIEFDYVDRNSTNTTSNRGHHLDGPRCGFPDLYEPWPGARRGQLMVLISQTGPSAVLFYD